MVTISTTSNQNVCEEKEVIEQFQLFYFWYGSIDKSNFVGGCYSWQKEPQAVHWFFLFQIKKRNLQIDKNDHFEKKGNFREPVAKFDK